MQKHVRFLLFYAGIYGSVAFGYPLSVGEPLPRTLYRKWCDARSAR